MEVALLHLTPSLFTMVYFKKFILRVGGSISGVTKIIYSNEIDLYILARYGDYTCSI